MIVSPLLNDVVARALAEDLQSGDLTTEATVESSCRGIGRAVARSELIACGAEVFARVFYRLDPGVRVERLMEDGTLVSAGTELWRVEGAAQSILMAERTALNFAQRLSGIATLTSRFVEKVAGTSCRILDTRKTTPGWRLLEKQAVVHGGGCNHRTGLYDMILIKDNHIAAAGSVIQAVTRAREYLSSADYRVQFGDEDAVVDIEIEVTSAAQLSDAISAGATRLLLDNQSVDSLRTLVTAARKQNSDVKLEASGNVSLENVAEIAATGVDFISIGALTHSAPASDFSMRIVAS